MHQLRQKDEYHIWLPLEPSGRAVILVPLGDGQFDTIEVMPGMCYPMGVHIRV